MRNLKRALSLALASIMVIGMMVTGASAATSYDDFSDKDKIVNTEAVNTMVSLGVIDGRTTGDFDPTGIVTRGEMAKLITYMLNGGKDPVLGSLTASFTDAKGVWSENYIAYCANLGIINGYGDGTVKPNATVTGTEAAKMILTALGYRSDIEGLTGGLWAINTNSLANKINLYDNLGGLNPNEGLNRDNAAQMVYNGVQADEVEYRNNYGEYSGVIYAQPRGTMLSNRFNAVKVTGILLANDKMTIETGEDLALEGRSLINVTAVTGYNRTDNPGLFGQISYKIATTDEMVGQEIVIYVKFLNHLSPNAANSTVVSQAILTDNNTVVETTGRLKDADAVRKALREGGLSNIGAPGAFKYDHLGRSTGVATGITDTIAGGTRSAGVLQRFIDNDGNGTPDVILQILPTLASVTNVNKSSEKYTFSTPIGSQVYADVVAEDELTKDQVLLVTKYSDGKYYVTEPKTAEGKVTAFNTSNNKVTIDGTAYGNGAGTQLAISGVSKVLDSTLVDNSYILYLDAYDNVLGYKETAVTIGNYAVIQGFTVNGSVSMGYTARMKILMQDGSTATYDVDAANSAVKLGLIGAGATTSAKESAIFKTTLLDPTNKGDVSTLINKLVSWSLDDDKNLTISNPVNVNGKYGTADLSNTANMNKNVSTYTRTGGTVVADDNTVFFFKNADGSRSVVTGLSKLPVNSLAMNGIGEVIYYKATGSNTEVAKAISVTLNQNFTSSKNFAFVSDDYSVGSANGTPIYTYPVVFSDGTTGSLVSKSNNADKNRVWEYANDTNDYVTFSAPDDHVYNARVDFIGNNTVGLVDAGSNTSKGSLVLNKAVEIWDVQDTEAISSVTALSENDIVAVIQDSIDKTVKAVFVYDRITGTLATKPTAITVTDKTGTVVIDAPDILAETAVLKKPVGDVDTFKVSYTTDAANQTVTIAVNGTKIENAKKQTNAGSYTSASAYTISTDDIARGYVNVTVDVAEVDKDTYTLDYKMPIAFTYDGTKYANVGEEVVIDSLTTDDLYQLSNVTDKTAAPMVVNAAGEISFVMPAEAITVEQVFKVTVPEAKTTEGIISNSTGWYTTNYQVGGVDVQDDIYLLATDTLTISIIWKAGVIGGTTGDTFTATAGGGSVSGTAVFDSGSFTSETTKTITISTWTADTVVTLAAANT